MDSTAGQRRPLNIEPLGLGHRNLLHERLRRIEIPVSEFSFANLYLFRQTHAYEVILEGEAMIQGVSRDGRRFIMPTGDARQIDPGFMKDMAARADFIYPVPEEWLSAFKESDYEISSSDADSDYIFSVEKLSAYHGRKLHRKRNLLRHFTGSYRHEALPLAGGRLDDAREVLDKWQEASGQAKEETDYYPCLEALELYDGLVLCGGIYYADGEPAGFIMGEELNPSTFVLRFAKARTRLRGVYQYMFSNFASVLSPKYTLVNLEQDMGMADMRKAKSSYFPDFMLRKFRAALKAR